MSLTIPKNIYDLIENKTNVYRRNLLGKKDIYENIFIYLNDDNNNKIEKVQFLFEITSVNQQMIKNFYTWLINSMYLVIKRILLSDEYTLEDDFDKRVSIVNSFIKSNITKDNIVEFDKIVEIVKTYLSDYNETNVMNTITSTRDDRFSIKKSGGALRFKRARKSSTQKRKKEQKITQKKIKRNHQRKRRYSHKIRKQIKYYTPEKEKRSRKRPRKLARK
jgi:hypothetical protein